MSSNSYNTSNELTSTPAAEFTFDNNGNTLSKTDSTGTRAYAWDFENRLTSVVLPGTGLTVTFKPMALAFAMFRGLLPGDHHLQVRIRWETLRDFKHFEKTFTPMSHNHEPLAGHEIHKHFTPRFRTDVDNDISHRLFT